MEVLIMDTEGLGSTMESINYDSKIFLFALLLSSYFIFNSVGTIDENSLQDLSLAINVANDLQVKSNQLLKGKKLADQEISKNFPSFLWVVRDFMLQLKDYYGNEIKEEDYLENALTLHKGTSEAIKSKNHLRSLLKVTRMIYF